MACQHTCPRCMGLIPNDREPGAYPGARSRLDSSIEICSACGTEEALQQFFGTGATPVAEWPIEREAVA